MITITKQQYNAILSHARQGLPNEACGLIGGRTDGSNAVAEQIYTLSNADRSPEHFSMKPEEQFAAIKKMRQNGEALLGNFHSHPSSPARMSEEDKRLAFDKSLRYLILSLENSSKPVLKCFHINKNCAVTEEQITIKGD